MAQIPRGDYVGHPFSIVSPQGYWPNFYSNTTYHSIEFTLATGQTNYNVKSGQGGWTNFTTARHIQIETDETISARFNATGNDAKTITALSSPFFYDHLDITNVFITNNSGATATIRIMLT